jgi:transposase InsO family protein
MPWKEHRIMSSKIAFIEQASKAGANVAALCRQHGISRQTGHKWLKRFREVGYEGLEELSRRPRSSPLATGEEVIAALLAARAKHPRWGARKLARLLGREFGELAPSERTVARVLDRFGQIHRRRKQRGLSIVERAPEVKAEASNDVWTIDFKGWWRATDGARCNPLTVRDALSRFVLAVVLVPQSTAEQVRPILERLFRRYGVPKAIQCDNGSPFICVRAAAGLTKLSAWWVSLGIRIVRSRLGCPQDNGGHERMHLDIANELQVLPEASLALQQRAADRWRQEFNHVRPHDALDGQTPSDVYRPSPARLKVRVPVYPMGWLTKKVKKDGTVGHGHFLSTAIAGQLVGLQPIGGLRYRAWFHDVDLGAIEMTPSIPVLSRLAS